MTRRTNIVVGLGAVAVVALFVTTRVVSQDKPAQSPQSDEWAEMMAKWSALNAKGPEHEGFKEMVGVFDADTKMWMAPGAPVTESRGTAEFRLLLDGRYIEQIFKCDMMGAPYEGRGLEGYDQMRKKYVSVWMDNMSTGMMISEGAADASGKVCTFFGKMDDIMTGERDKICRSVLRTIDKDTVVYEMYDRSPDAGEWKTMEITYKRRK